MEEQLEQTIGELIDEYRKIQLSRADLAKQEKELIEKQKGLREGIFAAFEAQKTTAGRGSLAAASITELDVPKIVDEAAAEKFLKRKKWAHVYSRKFEVNNPAWREAKFMHGADLPGIETVIVRNLSVTKI